MKKVTFIFFFLSFGLHAQELKPLTPEEVSQRLLPPFRQLAFAPVTTVTLEEILKRKKTEREAPIPRLKNADSVDVSFLEIPGLQPTDPSFPVRIYKPKFSTKSGPVMLWFHGGGFVQGTLNWDHHRCANFAIRGGITVISVDYRLAPENPYPAGLHDAYAAALWARQNVSKFGGDPDRMIVGGASAGAALAGGLALMARDKGEFKVQMQILEIPPCDLDTTRTSVVEYYNIPGVKGADLTVLLKYYLGDAYGKVVPEYVLPGLATNLKGLPPTLITTAGVDPLRDGGIAYADRLIKAGVATELHNYAGYAHGMALPGEDALIYRFIHQYLTLTPK